jgi:hypothetical protein
MKQLLSILFFSCAIAVVAQTEPTQSSTTPTAPSNNAVKPPTMAPPPSPSSPAASGTSAPAPTEPDVQPAGDASTTPTVRKFPEAKGEDVDARIAVPPLPKKKVTLIGGTVKEIDPIRNRMTIDIYGAKKEMKVIFDDRTKISRNGADVTQFVIHKGDRVYLDTQQVRDKIFAKQIQVVTKLEAADLSGQVVNFNPRTREVEIRDSLSAQPVRFVVDKDAAITLSGGKAATVADLQPGALVTAHFNASDANRGVIRDLNILAAPGTEFTLYGNVNHLDLHNGTMAVQNKADDKAYEVKFAPGQFQVDDLKMGSEVAVTARFDGKQYVAQSLNITSSDESQDRVDSDQGEERNVNKLDPGRADKKHKKQEKKDDKDKDPSDESNPK